ncbi:hypothetical protein GOP47_0024039 [Adiantum capillus-veneris]|uniref:J domain-containing protein n=1 Tax=Adiantum capillus-veneris TaxID=13818 RepID=A0A9D4U4P1_ADICA|nr:hypothetical protein GOP47_0024039 [Adiantum capillus-veneris]
MDAIGNGNALSALAIVVSSAAPSLRSRACSQARPSHSRILVAASQDASGGVAAAPAEPSPPTTDLLRSSALDTPSTSLITYANIQKAFKGEALTTADHYGVLGLAPAASYQEVEIAFRRRCESVLQQGLSEEEARKRLIALKGSYDVLSSEEERRLYDWSLLQQGKSATDAYSWPFEADITQSECDPFPPPRPVDEEAIRRVRNLFLGWLALSVVLNLFLKRNKKVDTVSSERGRDVASEICKKTPSWKEIKGMPMAGSTSVATVVTQEGGLHPCPWARVMIGVLELLTGLRLSLSTEVEF